MKQLKETSISNDSLESKVYFIDGDEGDEIFLRFRANDDENFDVCSFNCCEAENVMQQAKDICEAVNNYNALKQSNKELVNALNKGCQALADIINAADNKEPYGLDELQALFLPDYNTMYEALQKAKQL